MRLEKLVVKEKKLVKLILIALVLCCTVTSFISFDMSSKIMKNVTYISNRDEEQFVYEFVSGMEIVQQFSCYEDFDFITISVNHHDAVTQGKILVDILDAKTKDILLREQLNATDSYKNTQMNISFEDIGGGKANKEYEIVLCSKDSGDVALGIYGYLSDSENASVNGEKTEYTLSIGIHKWTNIYKVLVVIILLIAMISVFVVIIGMTKFSLKDEQMFLLLSISFVVCMLVIWPGNSVYDEMRHYHTVYNYSNVLLGYGSAENITKLQMRKCDMPLNEMIQGVGELINAQAHNYGHYISRIVEPIIDRSICVVDISYAPIVENGTFFEYLPATIGMTVGRVLGMNYMGTMTLSRIMNVLFYIMICYYAIYKIPVLKSMVVLLAALPMNLYQVSGISYDGLTFAIGIVVFAFIIKLWCNSLSERDWILMIMAVFLLGSCKGGVYLTLLLLMFLIPREKFVNKKWLRVIGVMSIGGMSMLTSFIPTFMRWFGLGKNSSPIVNGVETVGGKLHLAFAFEEPFAFVELLVRTLVENMDMYLGQMLGYRTAWANNTINMTIIFIFLLLLILASMKEDEEDFAVSFTTRLGILTILILEIVGMHAIFLVDTSIYSNIIVGCQGRYFILFIPCILLLFRSEDIVFKKKREFLYPAFSMAQLIYLYFFMELFLCA